MSRHCRAVLIAITFFPIFMAPTRVHAQSCRAVVYFGNGILTDRQLAQDSRDKLRLEVNSELVRQGRETLPYNCFDYAYAATSDSKLAQLTDLIESYIQIAGDTLGTLWRWLAGGIDPTNALERAVQDLFVGFGNVSYVFNTDLQSQVVQYRTTLAAGSKVVIVAHSQGNLFANDAFRVLTTGVDGLPSVGPSSVSIVSVASPASFVAGGGPHTTLYGDVILATLGLPANTDIAGTPCMPYPSNQQIPGVNASQCHSFLSSYLKGTMSKPRIVSGVLAAIPIPATNPWMLTNTNVLRVRFAATIPQPSPDVLVVAFIGTGSSNSNAILDVYNQGVLVARESNAIPVFSNFFRSSTSSWPTGPIISFASFIGSVQGVVELRMSNGTATIDPNATAVAFGRSFAGGGANFTGAVIQSIEVVPR